MKTNKIVYNNMLFVLCLLGLNAVSSVAAQASATFEIMNKSTSPIWVSVFNDGKPLSEVVQRVGAKGFGAVAITSNKIDASKDTKLVIWTSNPGQVELGKKYIFAGATTLKPAPDYTYTFVKNKDILVTFNPGDARGNLYPQTGPLMGFLGKTESGLSLDNNIKRDDIRLTPKK